MNNPGQSENEFPVLILGAGLRKYRLMRQGDAWTLEPYQLVKGDEEPDPRRLSHYEARQLVNDWLDDAENWSP